jgi:hypothetical protein
MTTAAILGDILEPVLTPEVAQRIVNLRADATTQAKLEELAEKCSEGRLTSEEQRDYESYVEAIDVISILQAKARRLLREQAGP